VNWLGTPAEPALDNTVFDVHVKVRSMRAPAKAQLAVDAGRWQVTLAEGEDGVAPGQACVFYDRPGAGARVLGGGVICREEVTTSGHAASGRPDAKGAAA
jgi:tRNA-specific 2-thiouridylase